MIFSATKAVLRCVDKEVLTSGMQQAVKCVFSFSHDWDDLGKTAVFICGDVHKDMVISDGQVIIPHEVLTDANVGKMLRVGVYGIDGSGNVVIPTIMCSAGEVLPGADPFEDHGADPTPTIWEQMLADNAETRRVATEERVTTEEARDAALEAKEEAKTARDEAKGARAGAEDAQVAAERAQGEAQEAKAAAEQAKTDAITEKEAAQRAAMAASDAAGVSVAARNDALEAKRLAENSAEDAGAAATSAGLSATAAGNAATAASTSASEALTSKQNAKESENKSKTSETNAKNSENAAKASENNAKSSENASKLSEQNATKAMLAVQNMDVEASTLNPGSQANVSKTVDPNTGEVTLRFGIPVGNTGNGISSITLNPDFTLTVMYTNGNTWTSGSIRGQRGNGITRITFNDDYTMTIRDDDGNDWQSGNLRGATGNGIERIEKTGSAGVIDTYTIYFTDGTTWSYQVANSAEASADRITYSEDDPHPAGYAGNAINDLQIALDLVFTWITHKEADWEPRIASLESSRTTDEERISTLESAVSNHGTRLTTAEGKVTTLEEKAATAEANITKLTKRTEMVAGSVTLNNSQVFPFNNSQVTVPISVERDNQDYIVDYEVTAAVGNVGDIVISAKLVNGFKIEYTGSASSVTVKYQVLGGMA